MGDAVVLLEGPTTSPSPIAPSAPAPGTWSDSWYAAYAMPEQIRLTIADRTPAGCAFRCCVQSLLVDAEVDCAADPALCGDARA